MFLLVPAYPGCPGQTAVKWLLLVVVYTGRLTKEQIKAGYSALQCIAICIDKANFGAQLTAACNDFYTRIPHYFGSAVFVPMQNNVQSCLL